MEEGAVPLGCGVVLEDGLEEDLLDALFVPCPFCCYGDDRVGQGQGLLPK